MILVTVATGNVGKELVALLLESEQPIRVLTRDERNVAHLDPCVERVAALALIQSGHSGQAYELTGAELFTIGEMVQVIAKVLGKPIRYVSIPPIAAKLFMLKTGMNKVLVNALMEMLASLRRDEGAVVTDTFLRLTGQPPRTFEAWCREHIAAFQ